MGWTRSTLGAVGLRGPLLLALACACADPDGSAAVGAAVGAAVSAADSGRVTARAGAADSARAAGPVPPRPATDAVADAVADALGTTRPDPVTLRGPRSFYDGHPAANPDGTINVVVEIPAGTNAKWEAGPDGAMRLELRDGAPRVVRYLPYPGNYGLVPGTVQSAATGGDGDALDVLVLGPAVPRGSVVAARLIGVLRLTDTGERDDKLLAVAPDGPLGDVRSLADLDRVAPGAREIVGTWFGNYKGAGVMTVTGWGDADAARAVLAEAASGSAAVTPAP